MSELVTVLFIRARAVRRHFSLVTLFREIESVSGNCSPLNQPKPERTEPVQVAHFFQVCIGWNNWNWLLVAVEQETAVRFRVDCELWITVGPWQLLRFAGETHVRIEVVLAYCVSYVISVIATNYWV